MSEWFDWGLIGKDLSPIQKWLLLPMVPNPPQDFSDALPEAKTMSLEWVKHCISQIQLPETSYRRLKVALA